MSRKQVLYESYTITSREEYEALKARGIDALFYDKNLRLEIGLRKEIQEEIFGKGNHQRANQKFYRMAWEKSTPRMGSHFCQECHRKLESYSATYISHILSRGAHPAMAYDLRNFNILCPECHARWEGSDNRKMRINTQNEVIIKLLKSEYGDSK